jgi:hypothetical protein
MRVRSITGIATAAVLLVVLAIAPGRAATGHHLPVLAPWRPSLAVRFSGAMTSFNHPVDSADDRNGFVTMTVAGVDASQLLGLRSAASHAADRVARSCRCTVRGYQVLAHVPGRGVLVVASGVSPISDQDGSPATGPGTG